MASPDYGAVIGDFHWGELTYSRLLPDGGPRVTALRVGLHTPSDRSADPSSGSCDELTQHFGRVGILLGVGGQRPGELVHPFLQCGLLAGEHDTPYLPADLRGWRPAGLHSQRQHLVAEPDRDFLHLARAPVPPVGHAPPCPVD